jgi:hypothetical protein
MSTDPHDGVSSTGTENWMEGGTPHIEWAGEFLPRL